MNGVLFEDYLKWFWYPAVRRQTSDAFIMICDNLSALGDALTIMYGVEYVFLSLNYTAIYQPMDQVVISAVKRNARRELLCQLLSTMNNLEEL